VSSSRGMAASRVNVIALRIGVARAMAIAIGHF
jgi:hypothetical protein